ncbi:hypothetical protein AB1Y20_019372 [Prymnesium parvum]|uniref:Uncharacterized protein n=1 Tax=Prymnesium parvum TaxID=97485 RepID=A0AB34JQZ7_PRYPA
MATLLAVATTSEADGLLAKYGLEALAAHIGTIEVRTLLDMRALSNLQHGTLKVAGPQRDVLKYCEQLKQLDDSLGAASRVMTDGGAAVYASRVLDLVEEAARTQAIADWNTPGLAPGAPPAGASPLTAGELASALTGLAGRNASEASKEITTTHETERLAKVFTVYSLNMREGEYGNRRALYLANKHMGPASEHLYPSNEQMPYAAIKAAGLGAAKSADGFDAKVDGDGRVCFTPSDPVLANAKSSRQVAQQMKLKIMTLFVELCGEDVPPGFNAGTTGVKPGSADRSQVGMDEVWRFCSLLEQGARDVPVKEAWETIVECAERSLRDMTKPPTSYTLGNALYHEIAPLTSAINHFKATYQAQKLANASPKKGGGAKKERDDASDEGPSPSGPNGTYSRRQVAAVLKQIGAPYPYGKGKGKGKGKGGGSYDGNNGWLDDASVATSAVSNTVVEVKVSETTRAGRVNCRMIKATRCMRVAGRALPWTPAV